MAHSRAERPIPPAVADWLTDTFDMWALIDHASWARPNSNVWQIQLPSETGFLKLSPSSKSFDCESTAYLDWLPRAGSTPTRLPRLIAREPSLHALITSAVDGEVVRTLAAPLTEEQELRIHHAAGVAARTLHGLHTFSTEHEESVAKASRLDHLLQLSDQHRDISAEVLTDAEVSLVARAQGLAQQHAEACEIGFKHGDFQPRNWLTTSASDVDAHSLGIIDFEESGIGFALEDLGWLFAVVWKRQPTLRASFLAGYGRELTSAEEAFLSAFTVLGSLQHIAEGKEFNIQQKLDNGKAAIAIAGQAMIAGDL